MDFQHLQLPIVSIEDVLLGNLGMPGLESDWNLSTIAPNVSDVPFPHAYAILTFSVGILAFLLAVVGAIMNIVVIYIAVKILLKSDKRKTQHLCILSMAVADLIFAITHCPKTFFAFALNRLLHENLCTVIFYISHLTTVASSLSLLFINIDKFIYLRYPLRYLVLVTYGRGKLLILLCWCVATAWATFFVFGHFDAWHGQCPKGVDAQDSFAIYFFFVIVIFIMPITASLLISSRVYIVTKRATSTKYQLGMRRCGIQYAAAPLLVEAASASSRNSFHRFRASRTQPDMKIACFIFSTTLWSFCTSIPYRLFILIFYASGDQGWPQWLLLLAYASIISNPTGNPIITCAIQPQYQGRLVDLFRLRKNGRGTMTTTSTQKSSTSEGQHLSLL